VAEIDGRIVGAAALRTDTHEPDTVYLQMVAADPDVRRAGIGVAIMDFAFAFARERGAGVLKWNTVSFMTPAHELYTHLGYEPGQADELAENFTLFTYRVKL
jgi:GNAT superfamily N-acetyltransferase